MKAWEKYYTFIIILSIGIGLGLGQIDAWRGNAEFLIVPFLIIMLCAVFLQLPLHEVKKALAHAQFTNASLFINFIWTPFLAWLLAHLFLAEHPALWIGFIMLVVTPCTDWYLIFTKLAKGNMAASTMLLPINLVLQVLLLPFYLYLFTGTQDMISPHVFMESIGLVFLLPALLAWLTHRLGNGTRFYHSHFLSIVQVIPIVFLSLTIVAMFMAEGHILLSHLDLLLVLLVPLLLFFAFNFLFSRFTARILRFSKQDQTSLQFVTLARNSPVALALALTAFPHEPLIALTLIIGPLLELPLLAGATQLILFLNNK
ncbi:arsenic resistance protein [Salsuginibacillus kocurii]|uniref:arsenic resistance protein n=1 Tax=Salsuginibacillus kocurii TaxID=427078 RepID=UPI00036BCDAA|nr:bile acid:sodium symporter [Salsuginibacillus kocurii]